MHPSLNFRWNQRAIFLSLLLFWVDQLGINRSSDKHRSSQILLVKNFCIALLHFSCEKYSKSCVHQLTLVLTQAHCCWLVPWVAQNILLVHWLPKVVRDWISRLYWRHLVTYPFFIGPIGLVRSGALVNRLLAAYERAAIRWCCVNVILLKLSAIDRYSGTVYIKTVNDCCVDWLFYVWGTVLEFCQKRSAEAVSGVRTYMFL